MLLHSLTKRLCLAEKLCVHSQNICISIGKLYFIAFVSKHNISQGKCDSFARECKYFVRIKSFFEEHKWFVREHSFSGENSTFERNTYIRV